MASPQRMAPARRQAAARGTALRQQWAEEEDVEVEVEQEEQEEEEAPRRRRAGKGAPLARLDEAHSFAAMSACLTLTAFHSG